MRPAPSRRSMEPSRERRARSRTRRTRPRAHRRRALRAGRATRWTKPRRGRTPSTKLRSRPGPHLLVDPNVAKRIDVLQIGQPRAVVEDERRVEISDVSPDETAPDVEVDGDDRKLVVHQNRFG